MRNNFTQLITKVNHLNWRPQVVGLLLLFMMLVSQTAVGQTTEIYRDNFSDDSKITATLSRGTSSIVSQELRIVGISGNPRGYEGYIVTSNPITFHPDVTYSISIKARASTGAPARLEITSGTTQAGARSAAGNRILSTTTNNISDINDVTISTNYTVPSTQSRYIGFYVIHTVSNSPTLSLDDVIITATCNNFPAAPTVTPNSRCGNGPIQLTASGAPANGSYRWYTSSSGGTAIDGAIGATYTTPNISATTSYWVSTVSHAGCESATRTEVVATVNPIPGTPTVSPNSRCSTGTVTLGATVGINGTIVQWYTAASGGSPVATGPTFETPSISSTTTYYVSSYNETTNCESARVAVVATVHNNPTVLLADFSPICVQASATSLTGGSPAGGVYSGPGVTNGVFNPTTAGVGNHVITYTYTDGNACENSISKTIEVTAAPVVTLAPIDPVCENGSAFTLTGGQPAGGIYRVNGVVATQFNPASAGDGEHTITYTVTENDCSVTATRTLIVNPTPVVSFLPVSPVCVDAAEFELTGGRVGGVVPTAGTWVYSGRGVSDGIFNPAAAGAGSHTITYTYTSPEGCTSSATQNIVVNALPNVTLQSFNEVCVSAASFSLGGGLPAGGSYSGKGVTNGVFSPATAGEGEHTITYTYTNSNGCTSEATNTIVVKPLPGITVTDNLAICAGGSATLTANGATTYRWEPATGLSSTTGATVTASPSQTTTYTVYGITNGCESEARTVTVTVNPLPVATITPTGPTNFCEGNSVTLNAPVGNNYTYAWYLNGAAEVYSTNRSISVVSSGSYVLKVTNSFGCFTNSTPIEVNVVEIDPSVATITNTGPLTFCQGGSVLLQAAAAPSGQVYEYQWQVSSNNGVSWTDIEENAKERTYRADASGRYRVVVTNVPQEEGEAVCAKTSSPLTVTVNPLPIADAGNNQTLCAVAGSPTVFTMAGVATNGTGVWTVVNGSQTGGATASITDANSPNATVSVSGAGSVRVRYTVTSNTNPACSIDFKEVTLTVNPLPVANAGPNQTLCATGETTTFTLAGSVANGTGVWRVISGNATISDANSMTSTVRVTGTGSVVLELTGTSNTSPACGTDSDEVTLTVNPLPTAVAGDDQNKCATGNSTTFNLLGTVTNGSGVWSIVTGSGIASLSSTTSMTPTVTVTSPGTVVVRLTSNSTLTPQCTAASDDVTLRVFTTPVAAVAPVNPTPVCGGSVTLTASSTPANTNYTYQWYDQNGPISGATQSTYNASATGSYRVIITNPENGGCSSASSNTVQVTVNPVPAAPTNVTTNAAAICGSNTVTLSATAGTNANTVRWYSANTGGDLLATALSYSPNVTANTTYFAASYNTTTGCESSTRVPVSVTVNPIPGAPTNVVASPSSVCGSGSVTLSATVGSNASVVRWYDASSGGNLLTTGASITRNVTQTTTFYAASYNPTTNCESSTRTSVVVTSNTPIATPSITNLTPNKIYYSADASFILTGSNLGAGNTGEFSGPGVTKEGSSYRFTPCSALASGAESANISITYTVRNNSTRCENSVTVPITVKRSTYTTIVTADPFPTCRGQNTTFTAKVYRDAEVIYPYLVNEQGIPVKTDMVTPLGPREYPLPNPAYFEDPSSIPQILWINTYRYYQPKIVSGTLMDAGLFDYAWTKNMSGTQFANSPSINNAGLSSLDYFAVYVTNKNAGTTCAPAISSKISNRVYTAAPVAYEVNITSTNNIICQGGSVTVSANLNQSFGFWDDISLTLFLMHNRNGVITQLDSKAYTTADGFTVNFTDAGGAVGGLQSGDLLYIEFSSVIDRQSEVKSKCSQDFMTNQITVTVVGAQTMTAAASRCINGAAVPIGLTNSQAGVRYQLQRDGTNVGTPVVGTGEAITFGNFTEAGTYSVQAFAGTEACLSFGATVINVTPLPLVQTLSAANDGAYCSGGSGVVLTLGGSQNNVSYQLRRTVGNTTTNVGDPITGNGAAIVFPAQTVAGTYTVVATTVASNGVAGGCSQTMNNVQVIINPLPLAQTLTGGGNYCAGSGGVPIGLQSSQAGITYNLRNSAGSNVATVVGTGGAVSFGDFPAGTYSVQAVNTSTSCSLNMTGTIQVVENPQPTIFNVTGGGRFCADGTGVPIGLGNSQTGVSYQLVRTVNETTENVGSPVSGTGGPINLGSQTVAGVYSIVATSNTTPPCPIPMNGSATVAIDELPLAIEAQSSNYCKREEPEPEGGEIILPLSQIGVSYQLVNSLNQNVGNSIPGDGGKIMFGAHLAGNYRIIATNTATGCRRDILVPSTVAVDPTIALGEIHIYDENDVEIVNPAQMEAGKIYTFRVESNVLRANDTDIASIKWYIGDGSETGWGDPVQVGGTEFTMSEPMGTIQVSIRCEIPTNPGTCYDINAMLRIDTTPITPLPVELLYFNATKRGTDVVLDWATASELDNKGFEVQVSSDAKNFRVLSFVESRVNTTSLKQLYTFVDKENGKQGVRYYRLKQVDLDGKFEFFNIKAVHFDVVSANKVKAYPNPFQSEVELSIDAELDGELQITVTTATGQQLLQRTVQVAKGTNIEKLTLDPNLPRGVYIISTRMGDFNSHFKLLKQ